MRSIRTAWKRITTFLRRERVDREMDAELRAHIEAHADDLMRAGLTRDEALRRAHIALGGLDRTKEEVRDAVGISFLESLAQDLRFGLRMLRKNPGFTAVAVLTLALGIGANAAIFSVIDGILWQPLPYANPSQLVTITSHKRVGNGGVSLYSPLPPADVQTLRTMTLAVQQIASYKATRFTLTGEAAPELLGGAQVSADFFATMGATPLLGRPILSTDAQPGQDAVAVLSYPLWRTRFGSDPAILGRTISLDDRRYTIVGVMPQNFDFALNDATGRGLWTPLVVAPTDEHNQAAGGSIVARIKDGISYDALNAQLKTVAPRLWPELPAIMNGCEFYAASILPTLSILKAPLLVLTGAVAFVLLIACVNISALLLGRGWSRQREIAVRNALGATRSRIIRQLLSEAMLIAAAGCAAAVAVTAAATRLLQAVAPPQTLSKMSDAHLDLHVVGYLLALSLVSCALFALLPAVQVSGATINSAIKGDVAGPFGALSRRPNRLRSALVILEIAAAVILVIGAALMGRSLQSLMRVNLGFRADHVLTASIRFSPSVCDESKKDDVPRCKLAVGEVVDAVAKDSRVESIAAASSVPMRPGTGALGIRIEGQNTAFGFANGHLIVFRGISPGYFHALGTALLAGREFTSSDSAASTPVAIVNRAFAAQFLGSSQAIGARFRSDSLQNKPGPWIQIIGVVPNTAEENHSADAHAPDPQYYLPLSQLVYQFTPNIIVRTAMDPLAFLPTLRQEVAAVDGNAPLTDVATMDQIVSDSVALPRFSAVIVTSFGALGLTLALIGLYGIVSHRVTQRTHEIGVRIALGAQRANVLRLVLREAFLLAIAGIAAGLAGALALTRVLRSLLFEIKPNDPATFATVAFLLTAVALLASYIPARRAMRVDPMLALRHE